MNKRFLSNDYIVIVHYRNPFIGSAGTDKYIRLQVESYDEDGIDSYILFPVIKKVGINISGWGLVYNKSFIGVFSTNRIIETFKNVLKGKVCYGVYLHHTKWCDLPELEHILSFSDSMILYVHDFYTCCAQTNLLKNDLVFCGDARLSEKKCKNCIYYSESVEKKKTLRSFLQGFKNVFVITPSEFTANLWKYAFPEYADRIQVIEHYNVQIVKKSDCNQKHTTEKLNIAFIGDGIYSKGIDIWNEAIDNLKHKEQYNFFHLGRNGIRKEYITNILVDSAIDGKDAMIMQLKKNKIDIAVLFSIAPETYSFTFFETLKAGCYIVTNTQSGNIAVLTERFENGIIIEPNVSSLERVLNDADYIRKKVETYYQKLDHSWIEIEHNSSYKNIMKDSFSMINYESYKSSEFSTALIADLLYRIRYYRRLREAKNYDKEG